MGTLSPAVVPTVALPINRLITVTADLTAPNGKIFKQCEFRFKLPLDATTTIKCERFKFPPLIVARSNVTNAFADSIRYSKPPAEGECFSQETVGDGGLSNNSMMAEVFRSNKTCLACHAATSNNPSPAGGDILCPSSPDPNAPNNSLGMPKNPPLVADVIRRYFFSPVINQVPQGSAGMKQHLDVLRRAYCSDAKIKVTERGAPTQKSTRAVLEGWVREFANPSTLNYDQICK